MFENGFGGLAAADWQRWLQEFVDGGPAQLAEKAEKAGAPVEMVNEARRIRRQNDEEKSQWLRDEVGEDAIDRPEMAKVIPVASNVPGAAGMPGEAGTAHQPSLAKAAAQTASSQPLSAPKVEVQPVPDPGVAPPPINFNEALSNRRRAMAAKYAEAERAEAAKKAEPPPFCDVAQPSVAPKVEVKPREVPKAEFRIREGEPEWNSLPVEELLKAPKRPKRTEEEWITDLLAGPQRGLDYARKLAEASAELGYSQKRIEDEVKLRWKAKPAAKDDDAGVDPKQSTKLLAIGLGSDVRLWHSPEGVGYASVQIDEHWENYPINSKAFKAWLRTKYGNAYRTKIGETLHPQVVGDGPLKDAVSTLEGYANLKPETEIKPAVRVGKCNGAIWIDLGGPDWSSVKVTATGWDVVKYPDKPKVAFIRTQKMLPLPLPVREVDIGRRLANIQRLGEVLNVKPEQFVLAVGWLLQALNPDGPYPLIYPSGPSGLGKSTTTRLLCRTVDPNSVQIRKMNRPEDLLIAAKNNWVVAFDNCSSISRDWSDTLSMLATGIGVGKRANYTDDEEHSFVVERPVAFNGIPGDLTWAADLASRTIKLDVPALELRRTDTELEKTFAAVWPGVFGALLDGLVGALAGAEHINVADIELAAARLMDFEQWAEAGCRAMASTIGRLCGLMVPTARARWLQLQRPARLLGPLWVHGATARVLWLQDGRVVARAQSIQRRCQVLAGRRNAVEWRTTQADRAAGCPGHLHRTGSGFAAAWDQHAEWRGASPH
jgi:hypothetical protein